MMDWTGHGYDWSWIPMGVIMLLVLAALIAGGIVLVRRLPATRDDSATDALWVLRQRFVRGEIDEEEYTHKRDQLTR